jgi:hypothetical protein
MSSADGAYGVNQSCMLSNGRALAKWTMARQGMSAVLISRTAQLMGRRGVWRARPSSLAVILPVSRGENKEWRLRERYDRESSLALRRQRRTNTAQ